jgi:orotidine-5'-phosphate decarboxylase
MSERLLTEVIVALDLPTYEEAVHIVDLTGDRIQWYKVGYQSYFASGESLIRALLARGKKIFLDLKLHDIPNSVAGGIRSLGTLGISLLTVHASGGREMLSAAARARDEVNAAGAGALRLLAVTLLTSQSRQSLRDVGVAQTPLELVSIRAALAADCDIDGAVCAVDEVAVVRSRVGRDFLTVCPGIRPWGDAAGDQQRVATPTDAMLAGATAIVVGRPITQAADPAAATQAILDEIAKAVPIRNSIDPP